MEFGIGFALGGVVVGLVFSHLAAIRERLSNVEQSIKQKATAELKALEAKL